MKPSLCEICCNPLENIAYEKQNFSFYKCDVCKHIQISPLPSIESLQSAYLDGYGSSSNASDLEKVRAFANTQVNEFPIRIAKKLKLSRSAFILDIGCSYGYDLYRFRSLGFSNVYGLEISEKASAIAKEALNVTVFTSFEAIQSNGLKFDFVYLKHNLEHHREPRETLRKIESLLDPGAKLLVGVPNRQSINGAWGKRWEWVTPPIHIHYFNKRSLSKLFQSEPFETNGWFSQRGHGMPLLKHFLFFTPILNQFARKILGDPYNPESAPYRKLRNGVEGLCSLSAKLTRALSVPIKSVLCIGEELWWLGTFQPSERH